MANHPDKQIKIDKKQANTDALDKIDAQYPNHAERNRQSIDERGPKVKEGLDDKYDRDATN